MDTWQINRQLTTCFTKSYLSLKGETTYLFIYVTFMFPQYTECSYVPVFHSQMNDRLWMVINSIFIGIITQQ
jgi:hypothetical protein